MGDARRGAGVPLARTEEPGDAALTSARGAVVDPRADNAGPLKTESCEDGAPAPLPASSIDQGFQRSTEPRPNYALHARPDECVACLLPLDGDSAHWCRKCYARIKGAA